MSSITTDLGIVHYEVYGRGRPVILLQWLPMQRGIPATRSQRFPPAGHFIILEEPTRFSQILKAFLDEEIPAS